MLIADFRNARTISDEFCSFLHIQRRFLGDVGSRELESMLDFQNRDEKWISLEGID